MDKKMHCFRFALGMLLTSFMYTPNGQARDIDVCALGNLFAWRDAAALCPASCGDLSWTNGWSGLKVGMGCGSQTRKNNTDSTCTCSNTACCEACDQDVTSCSLSCYDQSPGSSAQTVCFVSCRAGWDSCKEKCRGCPDSKGRKKVEESLENLKQEKEKEIQSPSKSAPASETKKSLNQEESPNVKDPPSDE